MVELLNSVLQSNDNKQLVITDTTGVYEVTTDPTGWGSPNTAVTAINGSTHTLELLIRCHRANIDVTYTYIDLFAKFGSFTTIADLVYTITPDLLIDSDGNALGTIDSVFPDGVWHIDYVIDRGLGTEDVNTTVLLLDGNIRNNIYKQLMDIPSDYLNDKPSNKDMYQAMFNYSFLRGIEHTAYVAKEENLVFNLDILEKIYTNGSICTW